MERLYVFGVDRVIFEQMLDLPMRDHLLAFLDGRHDLATHPLPHYRWEKFAAFENDSSDQIYFRLESGFRVRRFFQGKTKILTHEDIMSSPELAVRTRDYIRSISPFNYSCLLKLFSKFTPYSFIRSVLDGNRASWIRGLVQCLQQAFEYWDGPESGDAKAVYELFSRFGWTRESCETVAARGFPPLPKEYEIYDDNFVNGWNTEETQFAFLYIKTLLEFGQPPHREEHQSHYWVWNRNLERTPEEEETWTFLLQFLNDLLSLEEYANPAVICFDIY